MLLVVLIDFCFWSFSVQIPEITLMPCLIVAPVVAELCVLLELLDKIQMACLYIRSQLYIRSEGREKALVTGNRVILVQGTAWGHFPQPSQEWEDEASCPLNNWPIPNTLCRSPFQILNNTEMLLPRRLREGRAAMATTLE